MAGVLQEGRLVGLVDVDASSGSSSSSSSGSTTSTQTKPVEATTTPKATDVAAPANAAGGAYTVASGDTLSAIGAAHGTTAQALAQRNGIADPDAITPGQQLALG